MKLIKSISFSIIMCLLSTIVGVLLSLYFTFGVSSTLTNIKRITGTFDHYNKSTNKYVYPTVCLEDGTQFVIPPPLSRSFNEKEFMKETVKGDLIYLVIDLNDVDDQIVMVQTEKDIYLSLEDSEKALKSNAFLGIGIGLAMTLASIGLLIFFILLQRKKL